MLQITKLENFRARAAPLIFNPEQFQLLSNPPPLTRAHFMRGCWLLGCEVQKMGLNAPPERMTLQQASWDKLTINSGQPKGEIIIIIKIFLQL